MKLTLDNLLDWWDTKPGPDGLALQMRRTADARTITGLRLGWDDSATARPYPPAIQIDPMAGFGDVPARGGYLREWGTGDSPNETDAATVGDVRSLETPIHCKTYSQGFAAGATGTPAMVEADSEASRGYRDGEEAAKEKLGRYPPAPDRAASDYKTTPAGGGLDSDIRNYQRSLEPHIAEMKREIEGPRKWWPW